MTQQTETMANGQKDVAIIGGGACAVALMSQLLKFISKTSEDSREIRKITVIEKRNTVGPGLAYSSDCEGAIINVQADRMGIVADEPEHFSKWLASAGHEGLQGNFPPRTIYGQYLEATFNQLAEDIRSAGIDFEVVHDEAIDLHREGQNWSIYFKESKPITATDVVLALGNFPAVKYRSFKGKYGYFETPWPLSNLSIIPSDSAVCVLGCRLTAIDTVNFLAANGHSGPIYLASRSGRLPKIQSIEYGGSFATRYKLHVLAREMERSPAEAFVTLREIIKQELENVVPGIDWNTLLNDDTYNVAKVIEELRLDIELAEAANIPWQAVLRATTPIVDRYWQAISPEEQSEFLRLYGSVWASYRHAIPVENAFKLLNLLESGKVKLISLGNNKITRDASEYVITSRDNNKVRARYFIDATGIEFDASNTNSPLIDNLLDSGVLTAHKAGGVLVDATTLETPQKGLYVIGSMTRGVNFYTNAIGQNVTHASQVAKHITATPTQKSLHLALFVDGDSIAPAILSKLVAKLIDCGHTPFIYVGICKANKENPKESIEPKAIEAVTSDVEVDIPDLADILELQHCHGILVKTAQDLTAPSLAKELQDHHIDIVISFSHTKYCDRDIPADLEFPKTISSLYFDHFVPETVLDAVEKLSRGEYYISPVTIIPADALSPPDTC